MAINVQEYRARLLEERERLVQAGATSVGTAEPMPIDSDNDVVELAQQGPTVDTQKGIGDITLQRLHRVNAALQRLNDGTYGICIVCGSPIDLRRLDAEPATLTCIEHAPGQDAHPPTL